MARRLADIVCILAALTAAAAPVGAQEAAPPSKPVGRWEHKLTKGGGVALTIEDGRLHLVMKGDSRLTLHADYALTREGVLFGVVTSAEAPDGPDTDEQDLMDEPFSILYRVDEGVLVIRDVRSSVLSKDETTLLIGRYEKNRPPATEQALQQTSATPNKRSRGTGNTPMMPPEDGKETKWESNSPRQLRDKPLPPPTTPMFVPMPE